MGTGSGKGDDRARLATEMAIHSPLLDDIRLEGARGVLVSIAANEDLGLDEFSTVGEIVNQFASPEATVVIGTILDPDLGDEMRVTVVATGLPKSARATATTPMRLVAGQPAPVPTAQQAPASVPAAATGTSSASYDYDTPAYLRNQKVANGGTAPRSTDANLLNIPAFLRRQAD